MSDPVRYLTPIILSTAAGCLVLLFLDIRLLIPLMLAHLVFCGYLGWTRARRGD